MYCVCCTQAVDYLRVCTFCTSTCTCECDDLYHFELCDDLYLLFLALSALTEEEEFVLVSHDDVPPREEAEKTANPTPPPAEEKEEQDGPTSDVRIIIASTQYDHSNVYLVHVHVP